MSATTSVKTITFHVTIVVEPDDPGYHAFCPALKGLHTGGDTPEEALEAALDGAALFLESMIRHGDPIPLEVCVAREKAEVGEGQQQYTRELSVAVA
jgi:predicted RNase H-like HicB family nuclease